MREIVHLQAGQCGNQIGSKFWEVSLFICVDGARSVSALFDESKTVHVDVYYGWWIILLCYLTMGNSIVLLNVVVSVLVVFFVSGVCMVSLFIVGISGIGIKL